LRKKGRLLKEIRLFHEFPGFKKNEKKPSHHIWGTPPFGEGGGENTGANQLLIAPIRGCWAPELGGGGVGEPSGGNGFTKCFAETGTRKEV